jgi:hypothetical protein
MPTVTISEIAARIAGPDEKLGVVIDKVKNWVKSGLLEPSSELNPGSGHARAFPETALIDALILHVLTAQVGMAAVRARAFSELFKHSRSAFKRTDFKRFVTIGRSADNARAEIGFAYAEGLSEHLLRSPHESHVVLDLQKLFKRLERTGG